MPPASSPGLLDRQRATRFSTDERAARVRFRRAMALMLMTLVLPGSAQLVAGNRRVGRIALRIWAVLVLTLVVTLVAGVFWHGLFFRLAFDTAALLWLRLLLTALAIGWAFLFIDAWRL